MNRSSARHRWVRMLPASGLILVGIVIGASWRSTGPTVSFAQVPLPPATPSERENSGIQASASEPGTAEWTQPRVQVIESRGGRDVAGSGSLIGFSHVDESGTQVITLVNTQKLWMAVYHVGAAGEIRLMSSRAIDADFTLQLNATEPLPDQIRRLQGRSPRRD